MLVAEYPVYPEQGRSDTELLVPGIGINQTIIFKDSVRNAF